MKIRNLIVVWVLLFYLFLTIIPILSYAQIPGLAIPVPGQDCGIASGDPAKSKNKCCVIDPGQGPPAQAKVPGILQWLADILYSVVLSVMSPVIMGLNNQIKNSAQTCTEGVPSTTNSKDPNCTCIQKANTSTDSVASLCNKLQDNGERAKCVACMTSTDEVKCIWTGLGDVSTNLGEFIGGKLLTWGIGVAGGISMLCIMYAAFMMQTSGGNAEQVKKAQQMLTSCITGLMLILFSVFILKLIGVDILKIPGFN